MSRERRTFAGSTFVTVAVPWGAFMLPAAARCSDGKVRRLTRIAATADSFYSVPAALKVEGRTVSGFVTPDDHAGLVFTATGRNGHLLP